MFLRSWDQIYLKMFVHQPHLTPFVLCNTGYEQWIMWDLNKKEDWNLIFIEVKLWLQMMCLCEFMMCYFISVWIVEQCFMLNINWSCRQEHNVFFPSHINGKEFWTMNLCAFWLHLLIHLLQCKLCHMLDIDVLSHYE